MLLNDRLMKVREIVETIGISKERVGYTRCPKKIVTFSKISVVWWAPS
jgi:hypothetical protein